MNNAKKAVIGLLIALMMVILSSTVTMAKSVMVFAPHEDDETLMTAGIIRNAVERGDAVKVVLITNGDSGQNPYVRIQETINAMTALGLGQQDIIFMGYGDYCLLRLYADTNPTEIITSWHYDQYNQPQAVTYGSPGSSVVDYHTLITGSPGDYNQVTLKGDFQSIINTYRPDDIYVPSVFDYHYDHSMSFLLVSEAIVKVKKQDNTYSPILHEGIIHPTVSEADWPTRESDPNPLSPFSAPANLEEKTQLRWSEVEIVPVPSSMQVTPRTGNLKHQAIADYPSTIPDGNNNWMYSFVKNDEIFWLNDFSNIALLATVTTSSENQSTGQLGTSAVDGIKTGAPFENNPFNEADRYPWVSRADIQKVYYQKEWAVTGVPNGSWIQLNWPQTYAINCIKLYDRPNVDDQIIASTLNFSDGSSINLGPLNFDGSPVTITFTTKRVQWVKLTITNSVGPNPGLMEFEVFKAPDPIDLGFESASNNWLNQAYEPGLTTFTWDNSVKRSGTASAKIYSTQANDSFWYINLPVRPYTNYRLSGYIRTNNVTLGYGAHLMMKCGNDWYDTAGRLGTTSWTQESIDFNSGSNTNIYVQCLLGHWPTWGGYSKGTAWFDDLSLTEM